MHLSSLRGLQFEQNVQTRQALETSCKICGFFCHRINALFYESFFFYIYKYKYSMPLEHQNCTINVNIHPDRHLTTSDLMTAMSMEGPAMTFKQHKCEQHTYLISIGNKHKLITVTSIHVQCYCAIVSDLRCTL